MADDGSVKIGIGADDSELKEKLEETEESLKGLGDEQKETQKETEKTTSKFKELAETIDRQTKELSDLKGEYAEALINFGKGSTEAKELEGKMSSLNTELSKNKEMYSKAANEAGKLSTALDENEKSFGTAEVAIGSFVGNALSNLASKIGETIGNIAALADETREYREDMGKLDAAFTSAGHSTETAQKAYDGFYKILGESDRTVEAVNHLAEMTTSTEDLTKWQTICAGVTARFGDSLPIEGLTEAANETAKVGKVTGPLADALNWAGISEDEFNKKLEKCNSEQERAALITNTLNGEYAAAAEEYNKLTANTQAARDATNNMEQAQAALGAAIEPVTTAWTNLKANAMQWFVDTGLPALQKGWQWILDNIPTVAVIVGGLTAAWLAFGGAQTIVTTVTKAYTIAQAALNAVMSANPIGLVILAITALVAGFMLLWKNSEEFREFWKDLWEIIKDAAKAVAEWFKDAWSATIEWLKGAVEKIKDFFEAAWEGIKNAFSAVGSFFSGVWEKIKGVFSAVGGWFSEKFTAAKNAILSAFSNIGAKFNEVKEKIFNAFSNIKEKFLSIGTNIVNGIWSGINNGYEWIKGKIRTWVGNVVDFCKKILGIKSPSRVFRDEVGKMISAGMAVGIEDNADLVTDATTGLFDNLKKVIDEEQKKNIKTVKDYNNEILEETNSHNWEREKIEKDTSKKLLDIEEKYNEAKKKKGADRVKLEKEKQEDILKVNEDYDLAIEKENERHAAAIEKIEDNIQQTITGKMQALVSLGDTYKENVKALWEDLDKSITDLQANYDNQLASRTESIANSLNLWNEASKNKVGAVELQKNLNSQVKMLEDYNTAIAKLEERNLNETLLNQLKGLGVGATGEIEALARMTDDALEKYVQTWEKKQELAKNAAVEELEPLKAETEAKIQAVTDAALDKYATLRAEYQEQGALLMAELKQAMIDAGQGGYEEIITQIDDYTSAGEDLMSGVVLGIANKSPALETAVKNAVTRAINAAKAAAGIASPSKVMKKEVGANLAEGVAVGWNDKVKDIRNQMAADMQGITARIKTAVSLENARMAQGVGVRDTGFTEVAQAVGMQTAGINSLASEYRRGNNAQVTVPLIIDGRELGHAILDLGSVESSRVGTNLVLT